MRRLGSGGSSDTVSLGVFLYDRAAGRTTRVAGEHALDAAGVSLSRGARFVAFVSSRASPAPTATAARTPTCSTGAPAASPWPAAAADRAVFNPVLSARGDRLAFETDATTLAPGTARRGYKVLVRDLRAGRTVLASVGTDGRR